jgi:hypothetical protein
VVKTLWQGGMFKTLLRREIFRKVKMKHPKTAKEFFNRDIRYSDYVKCDICSKKGAFDFRVDNICPKCFEKIEKAKRKNKKDLQ